MELIHAENVSRIHKLLNLQFHYHCHDPLHIKKLSQGRVENNRLQHSSYRKKLSLVIGETSYFQVFTKYIKMW